MKMLIDDILSFCDSEYTNQGKGPICNKCVHPASCGGGCENCLEEVHWHKESGMPDYLCPNIINFYACKYIYKYSSEIQYLLAESKVFSQIKDYHIVSIGCGASPDLMAIEGYFGSLEDKKISYLGFDINELWKPIHEQIINYSGHYSNMDVEYWYKDAIDYIKDHKIDKANILILQYVISHFYKSNKIGEINSFFENIIKNIVIQKEDGVPFIIIINDVNSCYTGRNTHQILVNKLKQNLFNTEISKFYFDYNISNSHQRYGKEHKHNSILYQIPQYLERYNPWERCSGAQLLIEIS